MRIPVRNLSTQGRALDERISLEALGLEGEEWDPEGEATVRGKVTRLREDEVHVEGRVGVSLWVDCVRCAERFVLPIEGAFDVYYKQVDVAPGAASLPESTDAAFEYFTGHHVDLTPALRDALLLSLPSRRLCRPDCLGLCLRCGENLNEGACACAGQTEAPAATNPFQQFFQNRQR